MAARRGWFLPEGVDSGLHLALKPGARNDAPPSAVAHWTRPLAPVSRFSLEESVEDALIHVAACLTRADALVVWESAARLEKLDTQGLRAIRWPSTAAAWCAAHVDGLSDSGLETIFVYRLTPWGIPFRQQVVIAGHRVDVLIGERLVTQVDGHAYHSRPSDRARDARHDAELALRGYTVLRFTYAQVLHDWPSVARTISRAMAAGAHRAR